MFCGIKETNQQNQRSQFTVDPLKSVDFAFPQGSVVDRFHESVVIGFLLTIFFFFSIIKVMHMLSPCISV